MFEKTIRYKGHAEKVKLLRELGFFDSSERKLNGSVVVPRRLTEEFFDEKLKLPDMGDTIILKVKVSGIKNRKKITHEANMIYRCDANPDFTGMSITTACPASITAQMIGENMISGKGILTMEEIAPNERIFDEFIKRLSDRGIKINLSESPGK